MGQDNARLGMLLMVGFCFFAPLSETFVKLIGSALPLLMVVFARFAAPILLVRPRLWRDRAHWLHRDHLPLILLRSVLHLLAIGCFFTSLRFLPLADALAIAYIMPFLVLIVGWISGEQIRPIQLALVILGFLGTLMVVQPSFARVGFPALLPVAVAFLFVGFMFLTRRLTQIIDPIDLQALNGISATAILLPILCIGTALAWPEARFVETTGLQLIYLVLIGLLGTVAHVMMTYCLKLAKPTAVATVQYLEIPFGAMFGFAIFLEIPNGLAALGIVTVIIAGLLVVATTPKRAAQP